MSAGRGGGLAAWSVHHPVGVSAIALAVLVVGLFALGRLSVDLLPDIIYPEIRVRVLDPGVPAQIMEDRITRQLEEQLAITEDAVAIQSRSNEGQSSVDLSFEYGKDIDLALRDASTRLDRAKRFLPDTIDPPVIYKRDPSQIPVLELVVSSAGEDPIRLRDWVDYEFSKLFLNLPGVAAVEVGGGLVREIQVLPDLERLTAVGLTLQDLVDTLGEENLELAGGRLNLPTRELSSRTAARFTSVAEIAALPLPLDDGSSLRLDQVASVLDTHRDERIRVRLDDIPGVKVSIQKQPRANTVAVADAVEMRLETLKSQGLLPSGVTVRKVSDQALHVRNALDNATLAALSGTLLAMAVVYLFLGNLRRTLIIGSAIPLAVMVTFVLMEAVGLTFNIMTLGGLALGVGMLVDNTIVMLENIQRHQQAGEAPTVAGENAAGEIHGAVVAATSTNLAAVLPFLFVGGLVGLLFRELIVTISAAIVASLVVALTVVPAWGVRVRGQAGGRLRARVDGVVRWLQERYAAGVRHLLRLRTLQAALVIGLTGALALAVPVFTRGDQQFLPEIDDGQIMVYLTADPGIALDVMDADVKRIEALIRSQPEVENLFALVGGSIFGRTERETSNRASLTLQLVPREARQESSSAWIRRVKGEIEQLKLAGVEVRMRTRGIRGIQVSRSDDDLSVRLQGPDLDTLARLADGVMQRIEGVAGLSNLQHSAAETRQELALTLDRTRMADLGLSAEDVGHALRRALDGEVVTEFIDGDRAYDIRLRLPPARTRGPADLEQLLLSPGAGQPPLRVGDVARLELLVAPAEIRRDNQRRIVEVHGSIADDAVPETVYTAVDERLADFPLPPGYRMYDGGEMEALQEGRRLGGVLLGLALFLVFVVMAVQYESLRNPLVILFSVPFAAVGVAAGLKVAGLPLSIPVWLGMIMLAGIVVNNAIVLVEYIGIERKAGRGVDAAIVEAARLRLRPILMTTLTTVAGMLPLAIGWGQGAELLQPLAVALIAGLSVSLGVTLLLIPIIYRWLHPERVAAG